MVLSIIASVSTIPQIFWCGNSVRMSRWRDWDKWNLSNLTFLFIALAQVVIAITASVFSCRTLLRWRRSCNFQSFEDNAAIPLNAMVLPTSSTQQNLGKLINF